MISWTRKILILVLFAIIPLTLLAGSKRSEDTLAVQVEQRMSGVIPNGVVVVVDESTRTAYLRGSVSSQEEIDRITEVVRAIDGVRVVSSTLEVTEEPLLDEVDEIETTQTIEVDPLIEIDPSIEVNPYEETPIEVRTVIAQPDLSLEDAVEEAIKSEGLMGQSKVRINAEDGVVTLTGTALSEAQADRMVALARMVPGVVAVQPNLALRDERRVYQVKPSFDRDKEGREVGEGLSRVDTEEGDVEVQINVDPLDEEDDQ